MRFLNKFYSLVKSVYLNDSRFSNNLRHTLRIFFEREVKTKHTPSLFGTVFKGSKWVDYKTFNINKLLIKTGLSYFTYMLFTIILLTTFLGRSKAEQYFGFFPFFSYINFILGYVPLVLHDLWSQVLFTVYILYLYSVHVFTNFLTSFSNIFFQSLSNYKQTVKNSPSTPNGITRHTNSPLNKVLSSSNVTKQPNLRSMLDFSKILNYVKSNTTNFSNTIPGITNYKVTPVINLSLYKVNTTTQTKSLTRNIRLITSTEARYSFNDFLLPYINSHKNITINLNTLSTISKQLKNYNSFDFNIEKNLQSAKQDRWLIRNSLLSESIINNTFSITQAKKIIGLGTLDKDLSSKSLWLPTKTSNSSSLESNLQLNYLLNNFTTNTDNHSLNSKNFNKPNFSNLNFFENSRYWVFKKYFFTNQQLFNGLVTNPLRKQTNVNNNLSYVNTVLTLTNADNSWGSLSTNLTPSLVTTNNTQPLTMPKPENTQTKTFVNVNTANLDIFAGKNINFFATLTSNPQNSFFINTYQNNLTSKTLKNIKSTSFFKV